MSVFVIDLNEFAGEMSRVARARRAVSKLAGLRRASAISSCTVFAGTVGFTTSTLLREVAKVIGARSRKRMIVEPLVEIRVHCEPAERTDHDGVAVRRRMRRDFGGQAAGGACAVVDDDLIAEHRREFRRYGSRNDIEAAARGIRCDESERAWFRMIGRRVDGDTRHTVQKMIAVATGFLVPFP